MPGALGHRALPLRLRSAPSALRPSCARSAFQKIAWPARNGARQVARGGSGTTFGSDLGRSGDHFRAFFGRFCGRAGVSTKNARPSQNTGRSDRIRRPGSPRATQKRPKIVPGASRERLSEKNAPKNRFGTSRAHFLVAPGGPGGVRGRPEARRECRESSPSASRSVPGAPPKPPESPQIAPRTPGSDFGRPMCDPCSKNHAF